MHRPSFKALAAAALAALALGSAHAGLSISEVAPYASGNTPFAVDWFELTNTGSNALSLSGWKMDDNSNLFSASVPLSGISSIAAGESVIFIECASGCAALAGFQSYWGTPVAGVQIGTYSGSGVGLSTGGDAVNVFDGNGAVLARVDFGASTIGRSFDNAAGLNNVTLSTLSSLGIHGAFSSTVNVTSGSGPDIGSPGTIAAVPEPASVAMLAVGLVMTAGMARRRSR